MTKVLIAGVLCESKKDQPINICVTPVPSMYKSLWILAMLIRPTNLSLLTHIYLFKKKKKRKTQKTSQLTEASYSYGTFIGHPLRNVSYLIEKSCLFCFMISLWVLVLAIMLFCYMLY